MTLTLILTKALNLDMAKVKTMTRRSTTKKRSKTLNCDVRASSHNLFQAKQGWDCPTRKSTGQVIRGKIRLFWAGGGHSSQPDPPSQQETDRKPENYKTAAQLQQQVGDVGTNTSQLSGAGSLLQNGNIGTLGEGGQQRRWVLAFLMAIADIWLQVAEEGVASICQLLALFCSLHGLFAL